MLIINYYEHQNNLLINISWYQQVNMKKNQLKPLNIILEQINVHQYMCVINNRIFTFLEKKKVIHLFKQFLIYRENYNLNNLLCLYLYT